MYSPHEAMHFAVARIVFPNGQFRIVSTVQHPFELTLLYYAVPIVEYGTVQIVALLATIVFQTDTAL